MIADQLGRSWVFITQDVYLGRRAGNLAALQAYNPDLTPGVGADTEQE